MKTICFILFFVFSGLSVFAQNAENGAIIEMSGTVELKPAGSSEYTPAGVGDIVAQNTIVSTGFKSTAVIKVGNSTIVVQPITMLTLAEISRSQGTETVNVNLRAGRVQVEVKPPSGTRASFTVITPTATASVRGTEFDIDTRNIWVSEGIVRYSGHNRGHANVYAGGESMIDERRGKARHPMTINEEELLPRDIQGMESWATGRWQRQAGNRTGAGNGIRPELGTGLPPGPWGTGGRGGGGNTTSSDNGFGFGFVP